MKLHFTILCFLVKIVASQSQRPSSPCPETFTYETPGTDSDKWYGVLSLKTDEDLTGVWLRITLDREAELIGNWFGEASSTDNIAYVIRNPQYKLEAGPPVSVRFFVKYNPSRAAPKLVTISLNGKTICSAHKSENELGPTTPTLHISQLRPTQSGSSSSSNQNSRPSSSNNDNSRPGNSNSGTSRPSNSNSGTSRPSNSNGGTSRPSNSNGGTSRPNNSNSGGGSSQPINSNSANGRPGSSSSSNDRRPTNNNNVNNNGNPNRPSGSSNSRPSSNGSSSYNSESIEEPVRRTTSRPSYSSSGSNQNQGGNTYYENRPSGGALSIDEDTESENDSDFFPGDFASIIKPPQNRPNSNANQLGSRSSGCGTIAARPAPLISHGQDTWPGQWPWHAALYHSKGIQLMYTCGATLITDQHVVTAAHCVTKPRTTRPVNPSNILVYLGKYNLITFGPEVQDRGVSEIFIHPEYNYTVYFNDIAVLKLTRSVAVTNFVRPCCLWEGDSSLDNIIQEEGTVVGWGFDENRKLSSKLMQAKMPVVSTVDCIYSNRDFFSQFTFEKNYCAGFRNGTSVCNGDSGGGMVFPKRGTSGQNTAWQLRGLVSVGVALQGQGVCDPSQYIVFTDVAKHTHWIRQVVSL